MEKFNKALRGYNPDEVNKFLDDIISRVEEMVSEINNKNVKIRDYENKLKHYKAMEQTLNRSLLVAEETATQIKKNARDERDIIIKDARRNADRIVNDSLLRSEKINYKTIVAERNLIVFKKRLKSIVETQMDIIDNIDVDIETLDI